MCVRDSRGATRTLLENLGALVSRSMGDRDSTSRLLHRIPGETKIPGDSSNTYTPECRQTKVLIKRGRRFITQISYTRGNREFSRGVLLNNISGAKEERYVEAGHKSKTFKSIYQKDQIQNDHTQADYPGSTPRRLDDVDRPERCVFPCSSVPRTVEIPEISCGEANIRIYSIALRNNDSSKGLHEDDSTSNRAYQEDNGSVQLCVPRRLLGEGSGQVILGVKISKDDRIHVEDRSHNQLGEVGYRANAGFDLYRGQVFDQNGDSDNSRRSGGGCHGDSGSHKEGQKSDSTTVLEVPGVAEQLHIPDRMGQAAHKTVTALSAGLVEAQYGSHRGNHSDSTFGGRTYPLVGERGEFEKRSVPVTARARSHSSVRRKQDRLGSLSGVGRRNQWRMVRDRKIQAYQLARDEGNIQCTGPFSDDGGATKGEDQVRQHDSCRVYKQARGYSLGQSMLFNVGDAQVVQTEGHQIDGSIHSGENERLSGSILTPGPTARMVVMSSSSERNLSDLGDTVCGPIREFSHTEVTSVLLQGEGSRGVCNGQSVNQLEEPGGLCVSAGAVDSSGVAESEKRRKQSDFDSAKLGKTTVDVSPDRPAGRSTKEVASEAKTSKTSGTTKVSSESGNVKLICMESQRADLRKKGFRTKSAELATSDIRPTTCKTYGYKIQKYIDWCNKERVKHPRNSSVADVCNFLTDMFEGGASAHAVSGYISALSKWHRKVHGKRLCEIEELKNIRKATAIQRPPRKILFKAWNLSLVLQSLTREPFEPMVSAQMKYVSYKTVFLVAAATARRCSELGALSIAKNDFIERPQHIQIGYIPNFIPKNARVNYAGRTIVIPTFKDMASCEEEELMCPVRALRHYIERSALFRKNGEKRLFVTFGAGESQGQGASNKTLARWIVETIKYAYSSADEEDCQVLKMNAHSVRSVATTYAMMKGVAIQHILEAADWSSTTTFVNHYFKPGSGEGQAFASAVLKAVTL